MRQFYLSFFFIFFLALLILGSSEAEAATLKVSPASSTLSVGQNVTVNILLDTQNAAIDGVDVYSLNYNPVILQVQDANANQAGVQISAGSLFQITLVNSVSANAGTIQFSQVATGGSNYNNSGTLASVTFKALSGGTSPVTFDFTPGSTSESNVAGGGTDKLTSVTNGSFTVLGVDSTPPGISDFTVSNISTNSITLGWTTNEPTTSLVQYGLTVAYGAVANSSGTVSHSVTISGLSANTLYNYRIRATDNADNAANSSNFTFATLAVGATPPPPASGGGGGGGGGGSGSSPSPTPGITPRPSPVAPSPRPGVGPVPTPAPTPPPAGGPTPAGVPAPSLTRDLSIGSNGNDVLSLQRYLIAKGYLASGKNTGSFGFLTRDAVKRFQAANGVPATGFVGSLTRAKLKAQAGTVIAPTPSPVAPAGTAITQNLSLGMRSGQIVTLQNYLISRGYLSVGNNTGYFGPLTLQAVKRFQASKGITTTGTVGPLTRAAIR